MENRLFNRTPTYQNSNWHWTAAIQRIALKKQIWNKMQHLERITKKSKHAMCEAWNAWKGIYMHFCRLSIMQDFGKVIKGSNPTSSLRLNATSRSQKQTIIAFQNIISRNFVWKVWNGIISGFSTLLILRAFDSRLGGCNLEHWSQRKTPLKKGASKKI